MDRIEEWRCRGERVDFRGQPIHVYRRPGDGPGVLLLHGFPSSSFDWRGLLEALPDRAAIAFDFVGFGLSGKPRDHRYSLFWQADLTEEVVRWAGSRQVFVVAHDMGTSVATELMARDLEGRLPFELAGALLFNGSILLDRATPTAGQKLLRSPLGPLFARLAGKRFFIAQFGSLFSSDHPLSREEADDQWALLAHGGGHRLGHKLIVYMDERERYTEGWHGAFRDWPGALSLTWGMRDPVARPAVLDGLRELRCGVPVAELPDLGHYPQIEAPERIAAAVDEAMGRSA
jgi:pimeloyl-ACP methyl ester carboxylesterase